MAYLTFVTMIIIQSSHLACRTHNKQTSIVIKGTYNEIKKHPHK